ncbi:hypothetical protein GCM10027580_15000 [Corynebacterium faecale]
MAVRHVIRPDRSQAASAGTMSADLNRHDSTMNDQVEIPYPAPDGNRNEMLIISGPPDRSTEMAG